MMRRRLVLGLISGPLVHLTLWVLSDQYRYSFYAPDSFVELVAHVFGYRQIEDLPEARAVAVLMSGFIFWTGIVAIVMTIMKPGKR